VQSELRRVGCLSGEANGDWNATSQRSLSAFNRNAGTRLDVKTVSADTLDAIKQKPSRVCPLVCDHGFKADGDKCVKIVCAEGSFLNDDNECEKRRGKQPATARRDDMRQDRAPPQRPQVGGGFGAGRAAGGYGGGRAAGGSGQIYCDSVGCRPVARGCHLGYAGGGGPGNNANPEICN
jgi:hypothetical protein